jgi:hypothetical protein
MANSISIKDRPDLAIELIAPVKYTPYQEWGTGSLVRVPGELQAYASQFRGSSGSTTDPILALIGWVHRNKISEKWNIKGKNQAKRERTAAWLIFRKKKRVGSKPHPFFFYTPGGQSRMEKAKKLIIDKLKNIANK